MTDDDNLLEEIFHEARKGLKTDAVPRADEAPRDSCSSESLSISASDTWRYQDDAFKFACRRIRTRATELEKRLNKVTSADILASLNVHDDSIGVNDVTLDEDVQKESKDKKKVRFVFPPESITVPSTEKEDKVESLLHRIRQWLDPNCETSYPQIGDGRNKIYSAYWDAVRVVGQGRTNSEITFYNNPFDPRLQFDGLSHCVKRFKDCDTDKAKPSGNYLLWLDKVSDVVDECLRKYTSYLKSLRQETIILHEAIEKSEAVQKGSGLDSSSLMSKGFEFCLSQQDSQNLSEEEKSLLGKVRSVRKLWEKCNTNKGLQIPRRITSRKPPAVPRRRMTVMSEVKTSTWPQLTILGKGDVSGTSKESNLKGILRKKKCESPELPPSKAGDMTGRHSPQVWQRIAAEHIDEESLKHLTNATKERAGVKIMRPTVSAASETAAKSDSWAARVAQHIYTTTGTHTKASATVTRTSATTLVMNETSTATCTSSCQSDLFHSREAPSQIRGQESVSVAPNLTTSQASYLQKYAVSSKQHTMNTNATYETDQEKATTTKSQHSTAQQDKTTSDAQRPFNVSGQDPYSIAKTSTLNPLNSSPEWLRKLMAKNAVKSTSDLKQTTVASNVSTILSHSTKAPFFVPSTLREYKRGEEDENDAQQQGPSQTQEARCRVPPGFEKTVLDSGVVRTPPVAHQQQRTLHVPPAQHWQQPPGAIYAGVNGETFIQQAATFQHGPTRVVHQFQRPVAQIGGNIAIWHPRPPQGSYMLTDAHGKAVGVGIPGWNRVEIQGRPHVLVHHAQIPAPQLRTTARQCPAYTSGSTAPGVNPENYGQHPFNSHMTHQQSHLQQPKIPDVPTGAASGYERGDHFNGFAGGVQPPQMSYQSRMVPQFIPGVQHGPPLMPTEYAVFTASQHKPHTIIKQPHLNQNNNNSCDSSSSTGDFGECPTPAISEDSARVRHEVRAHKPVRAIRANLIQLA